MNINLPLPPFHCWIRQEDVEEVLRNPKSSEKLGIQETPDPHGTWTEKEWGGYFRRHWEDIAPTIEE